MIIINMIRLENVHISQLYRLYKGEKFKTMWLFNLFGFILCAILNVFSSRVGFGNIYTGDKDILLPFSAMMFLFYPLLIYLPEAHHKIISFGNQEITQTQLQQEQQQDFPWAFMITLISVTFAIVLHRMFLFNIDFANQQTKSLNSQKDSNLQLKKKKQKKTKNIEIKAETKIVKYYLSIALGLQNVVSSYYLTIQPNDKIVRNQFIIYGIFSFLINFSYGYVCGWSAVNSDFHKKLTYFINITILFGFILGLITTNSNDISSSNIFILILPCVCAGLMIYSCALVCLPLLFSNGEHQTQDKFRYGSIFTSLLMTVVYHPFCYLLRI